MSNSGPTSASHLTSVDNALRVILLLSERSTIRVADAAQELQVARSTAHRLLTTLKEHGFAEQDKANSAYRAGWALTKIGLAMLGRINVRAAALPALERLRAETGETVSLGVLEGPNIHFVHCLEGTRTVRVGDRTGLVLPASSTACGKAILAELPDSDLAARFPDEPLPALTASSPISREQLRAELADVRRNGYATNHEESEAGISAVAVAVHDITGKPVASLAIVVPAARFDRILTSKWVDLLAEAAATAERAIGTQQPGSRR